MLAKVSQTYPMSNKGTAPQMKCPCFLVWGHHRKWSGLRKEQRKGEGRKDVSLFRCLDRENPGKKERRMFFRCLVCLTYMPFYKGYVGIKYKGHGGNLMV